jgi:hypothetical protein
MLRRIGDLLFATEDLTRPVSADGTGVSEHPCT